MATLSQHIYQTLVDFPLTNLIDCHKANFILFMSQMMIYVCYLY